MNLTEKEIIILKASRTNNFCDCVEEGNTWVFAVIDESDLDPKVARGTISSLVKKGLIVVSDYEGKGRADDMTFSLTDEGKKVTIELTETSEAGEVQMSQSITPDFYQFTSEADAQQWLKDELLCCEGHKLMRKLPVDVQVWAIKQMPNKDSWDCNKDWWTSFYLIVASCYSEEIGVSLWTEVNELLGRLKG